MYDRTRMAAIVPVPTQTGEGMPKQKRDYRDLILNGPFDLIDRLFHTERASFRGVAALMAALGWLVYLEGGAREIHTISILAMCALVAFVGSFFHSA